MDLRAIAATFGVVFLMELGDKTQLCTLALAGERPWLAVFIGSAAALVVTSLIAALCGGFVQRYIPTLWLNRGVGVLFLALGVITLAKTFDAGATCP